MQLYNSFPDAPSNLEVAAEAFASAVSIAKARDLKVPDWAPQLTPEQAIRNDMEQATKCLIARLNGER